MKQYLSEDVYERLCNCCSVKEDIAPLAHAKWMQWQEKGNKRHLAKEDALIAVLELLDANSCNFDLTQDEYENIVDEI